MAPKSPKSLATKKEILDRKKRVLESKENILKAKKEVLHIVEQMLEQISEEWFLENVVKLCHADYDDVIQERSIERLCGYPLCSNQLKQIIKQNFHIVAKTNKVYDVTERKNFCGDKCFKASQYLKAQLSSVPLYMRRKEEEIKVHLLSDHDNRGSLGEEVEFRHKISKEEIEKDQPVQRTSSNFESLLNNEVKNCSDLLSGLKIKEHTFDEPYVFKSHLSEEKISNSDDAHVLDNSPEIDTDDSIDDKLFPQYDNLSALAEKHMPVPTKTKKSLLITPEAVTKTETDVGSPVLISYSSLRNIFKDWMTEDTYKYLVGEKYVYGLQADKLFKTMTTNDDISPDKLASVKNEYINLCLKMDSLPDVDLNESDGIDILDCADDIDHAEKSQIGVEKEFKRRSKNKNSCHGKKGSSATDMSNAPDARSNAILSRSKTPPLVGTDINESNTSKSVSSETKNTGVKKVRFKNEEVDKKRDELGATSKKPSSELNDGELHNSNELSEATSPVSPKYEGAVPYVHSISQNTLRKKVLINKFKSEYSRILPTIGLHYPDIRESVIQFVGTLSLTPANVMFKPKVWRVICVILLRILLRTVLKDLNEEEKFSKLGEDSVVAACINLADIDNLVGDILSPESVLALPILS